MNNVVNLLCSKMKAKYIMSKKVTFINFNPFSRDFNRYLWLMVNKLKSQIEGIFPSTVLDSLKEWHAFWNVISVTQHTPRKKG